MNAWSVLEEWLAHHDDGSWDEKPADERLAEAIRQVIDGRRNTLEAIARLDKTIEEIR